jgi:6,7-dimethyl-8-ribityllumazine synthase
MATVGNHLSNFSSSLLENCSEFRLGIVVSEWNESITSSLAKGAMEVFQQAKVAHVEQLKVPGSFELPLAAQFLFSTRSDLDGIVVIGNVLQGETKHFDFVCQGLTQGIMDVMLKFNKPISFCVLTDLNQEQSLDRSGGKHGNKGIECAAALLQMVKLQKKL